ncbi:MAG: BamA/TamA family outer membrane protein [Deltaproteobacteria bacterium]|nr:BamA/TamA family outer membrane protein [Deltaproteobacteria bacterium]
MPIPDHRPGDGRFARALALGALVSACAPRPVPRGPLVAQVTLRPSDVPRIPPARVLERIATQATAHFPPFEWVAAVPVLGLLDAITVDYRAYERGTLERDLERIRRFYRARGFYEAEVTAGRVVPLGDGGVRIEIAVREGLPVFLGAVRAPQNLLAATTSEAEREALLEAGAALGRIVSEYAAKPVEDPPRCAERARDTCAPRPRFDEERYDEVKRAIAREMSDAGFARAKVEGRVEVDLRSHEATVSFEVDPGPLCHFGPVRIVGNGELPEAVIRARLGILPGQRYSAERLASAHDDLVELGVFASVEVAPDLEASKSEPSSVPVVIAVQASKLRSVKLGIGAQVGSQVEAHAVVGWEDKNLLGGMRSLAVELRPGVVLFPSRVDNLFSRAPTDLVPQSALLASFRQPNFLERRTDLRVELSGRVYAPQIAPAPDPVPEGYNIVGYYELHGSVGLDRRFRFPRLASSLQLAANLRTQVDFPFSYNRPNLPPEYARVVVPYLDLLGAWDHRVDRTGRPARLEPQNGMFAAVDGQLAVGDARDVRLQPEIRFYRPFAQRVVLAVRGTFGVLFPFNYGDSLEGDRFERCNRVVPAPPECSRDLQLLSFRAFYSGGPFSNRGYGFREVGPHGQVQFATQRGQLAEFLPTGGTAMWELSAELRFSFLERLSWVLFLDGSDVVRTLGELRLDHPHLSPGTGFRVGTPVGPLRLDVGFRPPYLQQLGHPQLSYEEGGPGPTVPARFPWAWSLAVGEAF